MVPSSIGRDYCGPWKTPSNQQYKVVFCVDKRSLLNLQSPKKTNCGGGGGGGG